MAFDLATAKPVEGGFDLSTAKPVDEKPELTHPLAQSIEQGGLMGDYGSGFERGLTSLAGGAKQRFMEFTISRQEDRLKKFADALNSGEIEPNEQNLERFDQMSITLDKARQELSGGIENEMQMRQAYDEVFDRSPVKSTLGNITGQVAGLAATSPASLTSAPATLKGRMALGALGGAGAGYIQPTIEDESPVANAAIGAAIGGAAPPVIEKALVPAVSKAVGAPINLIRRLRANRTLVDEATGLPSPAFQSALERRGMDYGAIAEEADQLPVIRGDLSEDEVVDQIIRHQLENGSQSNALYRYRLQNGRVVNDPLGIEAARQGFKEGDISSIKTANRATKEQMQRMLSMKRQIESNTARGMDFRPTDVVGDQAMQRFRHVRSEADRLRNELNEFARGDGSGQNLIGRGGLRGLEINPGTVQQRFFDGLDNLEVSYAGSPPRLDFTNSRISEDRTSQRIIRSVTNILAKDGPIDARQAHLVKQQLDTMLDFNRQSAAGLTDAGEKFAKSVRASINDAIRDVSPRYAAINDDLSRALTSLNEFDDALGRVNVFADNANQSVGQTLRRLMSNVQSRADLDAALTALDDTARQMGGRFDTDIRRLVAFNKALDDRFGATARGSFQGEIESAIRSGPTQAAKDFALKKAAQKVEELRGINDTNAFNVIQRILSE